MPNSKNIERDLELTFDVLDRMISRFVSNFDAAPAAIAGPMSSSS